MFDKFKKSLNSILESFKYKELDEKRFNELRDELLLFLVENDVAYEVAEDILDNLKNTVLGRKFEKSINPSEYLRLSLKEYVRNIFDQVGWVDLDKMIEEMDRPASMIFMGINGVGKTTTIAKIGYRYKKMNYRVLFACSDTFRAGAIEQLEEHAKKLNIPIFKHEYGADPAAVAYDAIKYAESKRYDLVLIDTAGRQHSNINLMDELKKIVRVVEPDYNILVLDALAGNDAYYQAREFNEKVGYDGVIFAKVDADVKGGAIITVTHLYRKPILFLGIGQKYDDLIKFDIESFLNILFG
jgi:fused signal recognition particle receptor